ncbi:hypothetical protein [Oceanobacillus manasiensis]|uniref:hypothetical protein n=1 Tax=Oceanobacillus manasiensis TaxID=586413 RepID=UPI0005A80105|nr:hypothetical protein [Oceanobacillus manasiensis]
MSFFKRWSVYILCLFLIAAVYTDLTQGSLPTIPNDNRINLNYTAKQIKVQHSDTVLSVIEKINSPISQLNVENVITDFKLLNPDVDPFQIKIDQYYYFPVYE